jgi:hypothetical protein
MLAPNSMGFGHGLFGHGPFGHGPWVTFPFTPTLSVFSDRRYLTHAHAFIDRSEQRFLEASAEGRRLTYSFRLIGSATVAAISSWFVAANGPATRFLALDHTDGSSYVVRFGANALAEMVGPAAVHELPSLTFEVTR